MDIFNSEIRTNLDFMKDIWVNYPENRSRREFIAKKWWNALYNGSEVEEPRGFLEDGMKILLKFKEFTRNNKELTSKLVGDYFSRIKEKYDSEIFNELSEGDISKLDMMTKMEIKRFLAGRDNRMKNHLLDEAKKKRFKKKVERYNNMWDGVNGEITEYFSLEYEKMKRLRDTLGDSLMNRIGWDLSSYDNKEIFDIEELNNISLEDEKLNYLLKLLGKKEKKNRDSLNLWNGKISPNKKDLLGIHLSNDLIRLLPWELSQVHNRYLRSYFHSKYIENRLTTYLLSDQDEDISEDRDKPKGDSNGPYIICIDTSSSMAGFPEKLAKASVLYLLKVALEEGRKAYVIAFSGEKVIGEFEMTSDDGIQKALKFLKKTFHGGTDFITPIKRSIELIEKKRYKNADVLMVSDGIVKIPKEFLFHLDKVKKKLKFKIYSLIINNKEIEDLISDKVLYYNFKKRNIVKGSEYQFHNRSFITNHG